jgi:hypothetical protein
MRLFSSLLRHTHFPGCGVFLYTMVQQDNGGPGGAAFGLAGFH